MRKKILIIQNVEGSEVNDFVQDLVSSLKGAGATKPEQIRVTGSTQLLRGIPGGVVGIVIFRKQNQSEDELVQSLLRNYRVLYCYVDTFVDYRLKREDNAKPGELTSQRNLRGISLYGHSKFKYPVDTDDFANWLLSGRM